MNKNVPINKGNYSLETREREEQFEKNRSYGFEESYKDYRKKWSDLPKNFEVSEYPLEVDLELSSVCNLNCPFCYTISDDFKKRVSKKFMDFNIAKKVIEEISNKSVALRLSFRGESTLHPNFIEIIKYAKEKGLKEISFLTNGSKLTDAYFEEMLKAGVDWITISFDGLNEQYEYNRRPLKFNEMYERLCSIKNIKRKYNSIKPVIKLQTIWPAIQDNPSEYYNKLSPVCDLIAFNPIIDYSKSYSNENNYEENFACPMMYQRIFITSEGNAVPCCNDLLEEYSIGNVYSDSIYDIWHGERLNNLRNIHKLENGFKQIGICRKCSIPKKTREDKFCVNGREIIVKNYL